MAYRRVRAEMDVWPGWLVVVLELEVGNPELLYLLISGGRYLLTSHNFQPHSDQKAFKHTRRGNPGFLLLSSGAETM